MRQDVLTGHWTTLSTPIKPQIQAIINPQYTPGQFISDKDLSTETYANTQLTVQNGSILLMFCLANFPVLWFKDNDTIPLEQSPHFNPSLDPWSPWWTEEIDSHKNGSKTILPIWQYASFIDINISENEGGVYACRYPGSKEDYFVTTLMLRVDCSPAPTNNSTEPKILQTGFDVIELLDIESADIHLTLIYFKPIDLNCITYLLTPNGEKVEPEEHQILAPWQPRQKFTWQIKCTDEDSQDDYRLIIEYRSGNGSLVLLISYFKIILKKINREPFQIENNFPAYLPVGSVNEIQLKVDLDLDQMLLVLLTAEIELSVPGPPDRNKCAYDRVTSDKAYDECGIIGVRRSEAMGSTGFRGLKIVMVINVTGSCRISANIFIKETKPEVLPLEIVALENIFDPANSGQPVIRSDPHIISGVTMLTNKTISLRCILPACDWESICWCKKASDRDSQCIAWWTYNRHYPETSEGNMTKDSLINTSYSYGQVNPYIESYDLTFLKLQLDHGGWWSCDTNRNWFGKKPSPDFYFTVQDPMAPVFTDGKNSTTQEKKLEKNGQIDLSCKVQGLPAPIISWWQWNKDVLVNKKNNSDILEAQEPGNYECKAENEYGNISRKFIVHYYEGASILPVAISIPVLGFVILKLIGVLLWRKRRAKAMLFKELTRLLKQQPPDKMALDKKIPLNDQTYILSYNQTYEIKRHFFKMTDQIGQGQFGTVFKGELKPEGHNEARLVAVKVPKDPTNLEHYKDLIAELKIMTFIESHVNVVSLVGACTTNIENNNQMYVLTEYCEHGSLKDYLTKCWPIFEGFALNKNETGAMYSSAIDPLLNYAYQAANGMDYLALKNIIHRDLALRNLLLASGQVVKISDFGMSRQHQTVYQQNSSQGNLVPIRWMALESIISGQYTQKSDVWSFGVVLWEIFSCKIPYAQQGSAGVPILVAWLEEGHRMDKPKIAPKELYKLMLECWREDPNVRPTFSECKRHIGRILEQKSPSMYETVQKTLSEACHDLSSTLQSIDDAPAIDAEILISRLGTDFQNEMPIDFVVDQIRAQQENEEEKNEKEISCGYYLEPVQRNEKA